MSRIFKTRGQRTEDPGIGLSFERPVDRLLGADGNFRVERIGGINTARQIFLFLTSLNNRRFVGLVLATYAVVILVFAGLYMLIGVDQLQGAELVSIGERWRSALGFSVQTLTTVGYGNIAPMGSGAWVLAAIESMMGILGLGLVSAITYARIARPNARLLFSERGLIAPFREGWSFQVRLANLRSTLMMDVKARMMLVLADVDGQGERLDYYALPLQLKEITFMPLTWTLVHPIDGESPLAGISEQELRERRAEVIVIVQGMDEAYGQNVHSRRSYRWDEIVWGARFERAFRPSDDGGMRLELHKVHHHVPHVAPEHLPG
ncbi:MAG: hypothetical protein H6595_10945 [Flavobacteriales bacterium]|nr:hypothetical protein [Flavobacteriales bacterium]MCB9167979.1 hypothetical protein [Flavobacteriales bacterium]